MIATVVTVVSVLIFLALFILIKAISAKPQCSIIITALDPGNVATLIAEGNVAKAKANSIYIVTNCYDEKYFDHLKKHYLIKEVLTVVCGDT